MRVLIQAAQKRLKLKKKNVINYNRFYGFFAGPIHRLGGIVVRRFLVLLATPWSGSSHIAQSFISKVFGGPSFLVFLNIYLAKFTTSVPVKINTTLSVTIVQKVFNFSCMTMTPLFLKHEQPSVIQSSHLTPLPGQPKSLIIV